MTGAIKKLDDSLISQIAAGEVVERPASVIKELVENSLDAGARLIDVRIREGGKKFIQVSDDGCGISPHQLGIAIARHTTSKIVSFDDLFRLKTMGFRGEALASICSVAKVAVASRSKDGEASEILVEGGKVCDQRACAQPPGTTVSVKYLFYQMPARLKFLKTNETETAHIVGVLTRLALAHPHVGFFLGQDNRALLEVPQNQDLRRRAVALFGHDMAENLYDISARGAGMEIGGLFGHPQISRSQRSHVYFFVNGRAVQDKVLWHAVMESYRDVLMRGKFPVSVLHLKLDERLVDVNVHPTKAEVRFHKSQEVHHFVCNSLRQKLREAPWQDQRHASCELAETSVDIQPQNSLNQTRFDLREWGERYFSPSGNQTPIKSDQPLQKNLAFGKTPYAAMNPVGQLWGTYILCEADAKFILIDQHAAHERIGFEKLLLDHQQKGIPALNLLVPETFDLKPSDAAILKTYLGELTNFGLHIEFFGGNTFVLKAVPSLLKDKIKIGRLITDLIDDIQATGELVSLKDKLHHVLATMACHAQIRAHHHLNPDEMRALLAELDHYQFTNFCPHGRPVSVEVALEEIERWFKRVV